MSSNPLGKLVRSPLLHCLITGIALLWLVAEPEPPQTISMTAQQIKDLKIQFHQQTGHWPDKTQTESLVQSSLEQEILFQEGMDRGLEELPSVRVRLQKLGSFLKLADTPESQIKEAELLGLVQTDPVARKHIVSAMQEILVSENPIAQPDQESIEQYYQQNLESYKKPALFKISQVFFAGQQEASKKRAEQFLQSPAESVDQAIRQGDVFFSGHSFPLMSQSQLTKRFGDNFSRQLNELKAGQWAGPVESVYGWHAVMVHERKDSDYKSLPEVKEQIVAAMMRTSRSEMLSKKVSEFKADYQIDIEQPASLKITSLNATQQQEAAQ
ncbi:hypothetical protein EOPP23_05580 [Endozoicomonas sp. OPT23]|uniref:peptidylprolyl isomerase n=1 Tax=Endozoicomonas sp. OPT23 TaxID=2072845 RepID=UPI00129B45E8|nr:peptidylprolyl isomerase [Endozoicomonas sp. OPT23]MRI32455.1 hypothetical protein [Endozoicomonas sp. OPT23]